MQIIQSLHCEDNIQLEFTDKFRKIRPFLDVWKQRFLNHVKLTSNLSYDESMIKYYGKHRCKQCLKGKSIRFGYEASCLNQENGYLVNLELY